MKTILFLIATSATAASSSVTTSHAAAVATSTGDSTLSSSSLSRRSLRRAKAKISSEGNKVVKSNEEEEQPSRELFVPTSCYFTGDNAGEYSPTPCGAEPECGATNCCPDEDTCLQTASGWGGCYNQVGFAIINSGNVTNCLWQYSCCS